MEAQTKRPACPESLDAAGPFVTLASVLKPALGRRVTMLLNTADQPRTVPKNEFGTRQRSDSRPLALMVALWAFLAP